MMRAFDFRTRKSTASSTTSAIQPEPVPDPKTQIKEMINIQLKVSFLNFKNFF